VLAYAGIVSIRLAKQNVGRPQEGGDKFCLWVLVEILRGAHFDEAAETHHADAVAQVKGLFLVVGHQDGGHTELALDGLQAAAQVHADLGIQGAQRLIEQQHVGLQGQGAGKCHALLLAAGKLARHAVAQAHQPDEFEQFVAFAAASAARHFLDLQAELDVLRHGHILEQRVVLEDEADIARLGGQVGHVAFVQEDLALVGVRQAGDDVEHGGLAAAAGAEQHEELAVLDLQRNVIDDYLLAVSFGHTFQDDRHPRSSRSTFPSYK